MRRDYRCWLLIITLAAAGTGCATTSQPSANTVSQSLDAERIAQIHALALVVDAHADIELADQPSRYVGADGRSQVEPAKMRAGGVDAVVMSAAVGPGPRNAEGYAEAWATAQNEIGAVAKLVADPANQTVLATSPAALLAAHQAGQQALILGIQNARILGTDIDALDRLYDQGVRVFALTHMGHNDFADSSRPVFIGATGEYEVQAEHGGLSDLGRAAIARINALGGLIDVSQLSRQATMQVLELSSAPIIASHSNVQALSDVNRNLTDAEIDAIAANGGVIHISSFKGYLFDSNDAALDARIRAARRAAGIAEDYDYPFELYWEIDDSTVQRKFIDTVSGLLGPGDIADMVNHIDYVVARVGVEHVGIGTDFNHGSGIEGFSDASEALNVTRTLLERGYSAADVEAIWGGNFLRAWQQAAAQQAAATD